MGGAQAVRDAHAVLYLPLTCIESVDNYSRLVLASDFVSKAGVGRWQLEQAVATIDELLAQPDVGNADIKGMLNRIDQAWAVTSPFGAREHLKAARDAIATWIAEND